MNKLQEIVNAYSTKSVEIRLDSHWEDQDLEYGFKTLLTRDWNQKNINEDLAIGLISCIQNHHR